VAFLGLTMCLAERTGLGGATSFGGLATLNGVVAVIEVTAFVVATALSEAAALSVVATLLGLSVITLIWMGETLGMIALAIFFDAVALNSWLSDAFLIFISGDVVEVPHCVQYSLYSGRRRPHFRQNGIYSLYFFRKRITWCPLYFNT
jgi:hypothetical protein